MGIKTVIPLMLTVVLFGGVTIPALLARRYVYNSNQAPYKDTGFMWSPDWSSRMFEANEVYGSVYGFLLLGYIMVTQGSRRLAVLRRALLCFTIGEILQLGQMFCTIFPDPSPDRSELRTWTFTMFPVMYSLGLLVVHFYAKFRSVIASAYVLSIFGMCLLIPTHYMYTVDVLSAIFAAVFPFLVYHWYVRTTMSIWKRKALRWYEQDALAECNTLRAAHLLAYEQQRRDKSDSVSFFERVAAKMKRQVHVDHSHSRYHSTEQAGSGSASPDGPSGLSSDPLEEHLSISQQRLSDYGGVDDPPSSSALFSAGRRESTSVTPPLLAAARHEGGHYNEDGEGGLLQSYESPVAEYVLEEYRSPTFVGPRDEQLTLLKWNRELLQDAAKKTEKMRKIWVGTSFLVGASFVGLGGLGTLIFVEIANRERPIGIPLPEDIVFDFMPQVPEHTPDIMLYVLIGLVFLFCILSRYRFIVIRRTAFMWGMLMVMRCITVDATYPPDPSKLCQDRKHSVGTTCGDLIYSGHAVGFICAGFVVRYYVRIWWLEVLTWIYIAVSLLMVIASRLHYTRDVITALLVVLSFVHLAHLTIFWRPDRRARHLILRWFEFDVTYLEMRSTAKEGECGPAARQHHGPDDHHHHHPMTPIEQKKDDIGLSSGLNENEGKAGALSLNSDPTDPRLEGP